MRKATGFVSILAGFGVAAYVIAGSGTAPEEYESGAIAAAESVIVQAPQSAAFDRVAEPVPPANSPGAQPRADVRASTQPAPAPHESSAHKSKSARQDPVRMVSTRNAVLTPVGQSTSANGSTPLDRAALTRALQRELQRVGCYAGSISGVWTPSTRHAMKAFTERVNATLPVEEPDDILLAMLQSHQEKACGPGCPAGQNAAANGRCLPNALVARGTPAHPQAGQQASVVQTAPSALTAAVVDESAADASMPGRMALAGPKHETEINPPIADPAAARRNTERSKRAAHTKAREAEVPRNKRRMGVWLFQDAPVDRVLGR